MLAASSRAHQYDPDKNKEKCQFNLLHIAGKELSRSQSLGVNVNQRDLKSVRLALQRPFGQLAELLEKDGDYCHFDKELFHLRRYSK
jgi:hypothetical protein